MVDLYKDTLEMEQLLITYNVPLKLCGAGGTGFFYIQASPDQIKQLNKKTALVPVPIKIDHLGVKVECI